MTPYTPAPLDTTGVELPPALAGLLERLAENAHEVWADQRTRDGWAFGPARDDAAKRHPCLVPYADLPEAEKTYDRRLADEVLKVILTLGWRLLPPPAAGGPG